MSGDFANKEERERYKVGSDLKSYIKAHEEANDAQNSLLRIKNLYNIAISEQNYRTLDWILDSYRKKLLEWMAEIAKQYDDDFMATKVPKESYEDTFGNEGQRE